MKKKVIALLGGLLSFQLVQAGVVDTLRNVWYNWFLAAGKLNFLGLSAGGNVTAFTRILIWILVFTVFFAVMDAFSKAKKKNVLGFLNRGQAAIVAGVIATIAAIFLPTSVLLATGTGWATAIALFLIGGPVVGFAYLLITIPGKGKETKATVFVKIILCLLLYWILTAMQHNIRSLSS